MDGHHYSVPVNKHTALKHQHDTMQTESHAVKRTYPTGAKCKQDASNDEEPNSKCGRHCLTQCAYCHEYEQTEAKSVSVTGVICNEDLDDVRGEFSQDILNMLDKDGLKPNEESAPEWDTFNRLILQFMKEYVIPGISLAVAYKGRIIYTQAYGWARKNELFSSKHLCRIASVSKILTSLAVMKLNEEEKCNLNSRVFGPSGILPEFTISARGDRRLYQVTVKHLLQHSGGWDRDLVGDPCFWPHVARELGIQGPVMQRDLIQYMMTQKLQFSPGKKYAYSNFGYVVVGRIIEKISGMDYEAYTQNLLKTVGLGHLQLGKTKKDEAHPNEVEYFPSPSQMSVASVYPGEEKVPAPYGGYSMEAGDSDGGWIASPTDLLQLLMSMENSATIRILKKATIKLMLKKPSYARGSTWYGYGLDVAWSGKAWEHGGHIDGATSVVTRDKDGYMWALLSNYWPSDSDYTSLMSYCLNHVRTLAARPSVISHPSADWASSDCTCILFLRVPHRELDGLISHLRSQGLQTRWLNGYEFNGKTFFNIICYELDTELEVFYNLNFIQCIAKVNVAKQRNLNVIFMDSYIVDGELKYSCIMEQTDTPDDDVELFKSTSVDTLQEKCTQYNVEGKSIKLLTSQHINGVTQSTALFVKTRSPTWWTVGMDSDQFQSQCARQSHYGHMPSHVKAYSEGEDCRFSAVWCNPGPYRYTSEHDLSRYRLLTDLTLTAASGFTPLCVAGYEDSGSHKFAAVCVKKV